MFVSLLPPVAGSKGDVAVDVTDIGVVVAITVDTAIATTDGVVTVIVIVIVVTVTVTVIVVIDVIRR